MKKEEVCRRKKEALRKEEEQVANSPRTLRKVLFVGVTVLVFISLGVMLGCQQKTEVDAPKKTEVDAAKRLSGDVKIDGSSTVYPITEAVAEEFSKEYPDVNVTVGISGTGGGFEKFVVGETDINDASRPIKDEEIQKAEENGIGYIEFKLAYDGITVVVNPDNDWCEDITVEELKKIWEPGSKVKKWSDVRAEWPDEEIKLFGPDTDSGTFDYFTEEIVGEEGVSRSDYTASADDNVLVQGVAGEKYALGYFGFAYYEENKDKLKAVKVDGVEPTSDTIKNGEYTPLSRPIFIYVAKPSLEKEQVYEFVKFYLTKASEIVESVGYVPLEEDMYEKALNDLEG